MSRFDEQYIDLCRRILAEGEDIVNYAKNDKRDAAVSTAIQVRKLCACHTR